MNSQKIVFVVGPTSVGKTAVSLRLANEIHAEIVSCDAVQVYKELAIVSNKPSPEILRQIPHHLVNVVSVQEDFDVAAFRRQAVSAIEDILRRNKVPLVVGGSGLYMAVLLDGIFEGAAKDENFRQELQQEADEKGTDVLYQRLSTVDPKAAQKIHPNDLKRIVRALEVFEVRQEPISSLQKQRRGLWLEYDIRVFALNRLRAQLYERINQRVEAMFEEGLVEEIKKLRTLRLSQAARRIIGVGEVNGLIDGKYDASRAKYLMKLNTRHYAKRQLTWFRKDQRLKWIMLKDNDDQQEACFEIMREIQH